MMGGSNIFPVLPIIGWVNFAAALIMGTAASTLGGLEVIDGDFAGDLGTAAGARVWNQANVLCLSHRTLSEDMAREILSAWFDTDPGTRGSAGVAALAKVDGRQRR